MVYKAKQLQLGYEFANAIPTDHPKFKAYQEFRKKFGEDGNMLVIGIQTDKLFEEKIFNDYTQLVNDIKGVKGVEDVISIITAVNLIKDSATEKLGPRLYLKRGHFRKPRSIAPKMFFLVFRFIAVYYTILIQMHGCSVCI